MPRVIAESIVAGGYDCPTPLDWQRQCQWMREKIAEAIQAERDVRPPKGHILTDDGVVRKVLGTLPITADGCVVGDGARVYYEVIGQFSGEPIICEWDVTGAGDDIKVDTYYSTREAAEAAKKGAKKK